MNKLEVDWITFRRVTPNLYICTANFQNALAVKLKQGNGRSTDCSLGNYKQPIRRPSEMFRPLLQARIEE